MATAALKDLRLQSLADLQAYLATVGEPAFRAKQIYDWLWRKPVDGIDQMSNLSKGLREKLAADFAYHRVQIDDARQSADGSVKYGMRLWDGNLVESVLIPTESRVTACVSSQVGCSLTCKFCATGYMDLRRNLTSYEIYDQIEILHRESEARYGRPLTNVVYMGMGEPLLNYRNVMGSIERATSEDGLGMSPRRITISTAGIAKMIERMGDEGFRCEFALSLHAANDTKRSEIMPINESNSLVALEAALRHFTQKTGTRVTFEYIVFAGFNDDLSDAEELATFARKVPSKINIIEYNPIAEANFRFTSQQKLAAFQAHLERRGLIVNVRRSRGRDVDGACGQLAIKKRKAEGESVAS